MKQFADKAPFPV